MADPSSSEMTGGRAFDGALDIRFEQRVSNDHEATIMATARDMVAYRADGATLARVRVFPGGPAAGTPDSTVAMLKALVPSLLTSTSGQGPSDARSSPASVPSVPRSLGTSV